MVPATHNYLVCTIKPWHIEQYNHYSKRLPGRWKLVTGKAALTAALVDRLKPRYIFFPHWSWMVPESILQRSECICFHSTDLPSGRGGSPIQNLVIRGHSKTKITALQMTKDVDAGPVYLKKPLSLKGPAQEIFERMAAIIPQMIEYIVTHEPKPVAQKGAPSYFTRRTGKDNLLPKNASLEEIYNHIRMLDADTYPKSHLHYGNLTLAFSKARRARGRIIASVEITTGEQS